MDEIFLKAGYTKDKAPAADRGLGHHATNYYKNISDKVTRTCNLNDKLTVHITAANFQGTFSFEIGICAELIDDSWIDFKYYSLTYNDLTRLEQLEKMLIILWETANIGLKK